MVRDEGPDYGGSRSDGAGTFGIFDAFAELKRGRDAHLQGKDSTEA